MSFTRLMWTQLCVAEGDEIRMKRDAVAGRLAQADDKSWKEHMGT